MPRSPLLTLAFAATVARVSGTTPTGTPVPTPAPAAGATPAPTPVVTEVTEGGLCVDQGVTAASAARCADLGAAKFNPECLPACVYSYSDIGDTEKPYIQLQWMFAETCGLKMAALKQNMHTLPKIMKVAVTSVFTNWGIYVLGNFVAVALMTIFEVAPRGRRCWGIFPNPDGSPGGAYTKVLGPLYYLLTLYALFLMLMLVIRLFTEIHEYREEELTNAAKPGPWTVVTGGVTTSYEVPEAPAACTDAMNLLWPAYKETFQILVLMVFTWMDNAILMTQQVWVCVVMCVAQCRCLCCYCCKGCCGIMGWYCCNMCATSICLLTGLIVAMIYYAVGIAAGIIMYGLFVAIASAVLIGAGLAVRYILMGLTCGFCKPLAIPFAEQQALLYPLPLFQKTRTLGDDAEIPQIDGMDESMKALQGDYGSPQWQAKMGIPNPKVTLSFPAFYLIVSVPSLIIFNLVFCLWLAKNQIVFTKSYAASDLDWFTEGPTTVWPFQMQMVKALLVGLTEGLHDIFVTALTEFFTNFQPTMKMLTESAIKGMDPSNLMPGAEASDFVAAVFMGRFQITVLFVICRLTAFINRVEGEHEVDVSEEELSEEEGL